MNAITLGDFMFRIWPYIIPCFR